MASTLWLDTEFSGHNSAQLISLAIADPHGGHWYGVLPLPANVDPWVAEHVVPRLLDIPNVPMCYVPASAGPATFRASLIKYLRPRQGATIVADWPGDFRHLLAVFEGASFLESWCPRFLFQLINTPPGEPKPETPHNALSDAIALMRWDMAAHA